MRYITSDKIFSGLDYFDKGTVIAINDNGEIVDIFTHHESGNISIEKLYGIITPGFVNAHCHLELSHLKNKIKQHTGIVDFGLEVIKQRQAFSESEQLEAMRMADKEMVEAGIVLVGDISNTIDSIAIKKESPITYHTFVELIALNPQRAEEVFDKGRQTLTQFILKDLSASLSAHAPYSVSPQLINNISFFCQEINQPTCIHNQESSAENEFFKTKSGNYLKLYETLKLPLDFFKATNLSSLQSVLPCFIPEVPIQFVHNTYSSGQDVINVNKYLIQAFWCLCPMANLYIENKLPDVNLLLQYNCSLTIGTDSLASNHSLSIIDEINLLMQNNSALKLEILLKAATYNGAQFLNQLNKFGSIEKGKKPGLNIMTGVPGNYQVKKII